MKSNNLALLTASSLLFTIAPISNYSNLIFLNSSPNAFAQQTSKAHTLSGNFIGVVEPATGSAKIVSEGGSYHLVLSADFSTSTKGPDLHVLLDVAAKPGKYYKNLGKTINLGKLKSFDGAQHYVIPDVINVSQFKSVVIWCRTANANFAYAPLKQEK